MIDIKPTHLTLEEYKIYFHSGRVGRKVTTLGYNNCPRGCYPGSCKECTWFSVGEEVIFISPPRGNILYLDEECGHIIREPTSKHSYLDSGLYFDIKMLRQYNDTSNKPPYRMRKMLDENDINWWNKDG